MAKLNLADLVERAERLDAEARELGLVNPSTEKILRHHTEEHERSIAQERARRQREAERAERARRQMADPEERAFFAPPPAGTGEGEINNARPEMVAWLRARTGWGKPIHSLRVHPSDLAWIRYYVRPNGRDITPLSLLLEGQATVARLAQARAEQAEEDRHKHKLVSASAASDAGADAA